MTQSTLNSFDLDAECRAACERARGRIHIAPLPVYEPQRADFDLPLWLLTGALALAIALVGWRLPELLQIGVA